MLQKSHKGKSYKYKTEQWMLMQLNVKFHGQGLWFLATNLLETTDI